MSFDALLFDPHGLVLFWQLHSSLHSSPGADLGFKEGGFDIVTAEGGSW